MKCSKTKLIGPKLFDAKCIYPTCVSSKLCEFIDIVEKCNIKRYHAIPVLQKAIFINKQIYKSTRNTSNFGFNFSIFSRVLWKNSNI